MNSDFPREPGTAIVIGGSLAGLLAARVLADFYRRVTVVERDTLGAAIECRRGVPQGRHTHGLLAGGRAALEKLFPGISGQLLAAGAVPGDIIGESRWFLEGSYHCRFSSGLIGLLHEPAFSRGDGPGARAATAERRFSGQPGNPRPAHVPRQEPRGRRRLGRETLSADLVVDASGRGSHTPRWLEEMGYPKPLEERVEVALAYTTRSFRRHPRGYGRRCGGHYSPDTRRKARRRDAGAGRRDAGR